MEDELLKRLGWTAPSTTYFFNHEKHERARNFLFGNQSLIDTRNSGKLRRQAPWIRHFSGQWTEVDFN